MLCKRYFSIALMLASGIALLVMTAGSSYAMIYSDKDMELTGKLEVKAGVFTDSADSHTYPQYSAGQLFKERNMGYLQFDHDLKTLTGLDLNYHLVGRAVYDGVYDFGPKVFREAYDQNKAEFERYNTKWQAGLWEAYVNLKTGPVNVRLGRQNLSWGELIFLRVVDHINPMDNTWGGTGTESLDDRRIPLWMARVGYSPNAKFSFEGFLVPGAIDATTPPVTPWGSPYGLPEADLHALEAYGMNAGFNSSYGYAPDETRDMSHSRSGLKMTVTTAESQIALSYQNTYWDGSGLRFVTDVANASPLIPGSTLSVELKYPKVNIFGLSGNYVFADADFIMRGDIAHVQGVPVYINDINRPTQYIPFMGSFLPVYNSGSYTYRDFTNFGFSLEKNIWVRAINSSERISFTFEYYGNYCHNWDERMIFPIADPESDVEPTQKRYEQTLALNISSSWQKKWDVGLATLYNPSGSMFVIPSVTYRFNNPLTVTLDYAVVIGDNWVIPFAQDIDRDKATLMLKYEF